MIRGTTKNNVILDCCIVTDVVGGLCNFAKSTINVQQDSENNKIQQAVCYKYVNAMLYKSVYKITFYYIVHKDNLKQCIMQDMRILNLPILSKRDFFALLLINVLRYVAFECMC